MKGYKPSMFCDFPYDSVRQKTECEIVASNIMLILRRTGNVFRDVSWEEYRLERGKDGAHFIDGEYAFFEKVVAFTESGKYARLFSPVWRKGLPVHMFSVYHWLKYLAVSLYVEVKKCQR